MTTQAPPHYPLTNRPKLRLIRIEHYVSDGQPTFVLMDPLRLVAEQGLMVSVVAGGALIAADGTRTLPEIQAFIAEHTGLDLPVDMLQQLFAELDRLALLDNQRFVQIKQQVVADFRSAPFRPTSCAGSTYPDDPQALAQLLDDYFAAAEQHSAPADFRGIVSPHIDYARGGSVYAQTWLATAAAIKDAELVVVFGTDHQNGGLFTLTRQNYATPFGPLPTDQSVVDALVDIIGEEAAFADELNHRYEHSLELVLVWLHYLRRDNPPPIVPILNGSFYEYMLNGSSPDHDPTIRGVIEVLRKVAAERRTVFVASGDLAHLGPAFDTEPVTAGAGLEQLLQDDSGLMTAIANGDVDDFYGRIKVEQNARNVCGTAPIYLLLKSLGETEGQVLAYEQCPADPQGTSWVSVCGAVLG